MECENCGLSLEDECTCWCEGCGLLQSDCFCEGIKDLKKERKTMLGKRVKYKGEMYNVVMVMNFSNGQKGLRLSRLKDGYLIDVHSIEVEVVAPLEKRGNEDA